MDFTFNEDQQALRDSVSRFLMVEAAPEKLRDIWQTDAGRSSELRAKLAEQGLTALSVPEAHGGLGMGDVDWALMNQELGYFGIPDSLADTAYLATGLVFAVVDAVWLTWSNERLYRPTLNPVLADEVNLKAAAVFYVVYILGIMALVVSPATSWRSGQEVGPEVGSRGRKL